jgi:EmrB/QacA subfamily drug resistance transporter
LGAPPSLAVPDVPRYRLLLATVSFGSIIAPLNSTMLAVALPEIRDDFDVGHAAIAWLVSAYLIAMAVAQPIGGRIGDQLGRARVFRGGLIAFLSLSVAAAFAPTFETLLVLRTGQALVGAAVIPNGMAMLRESVPPERLGQSSGFTGSALSFSAAIGPLLGAALLAAGSWRLLFLMNVPLVGVALACQAALQYRSRGLPSKLTVDWAGGVSFALFLGAVTFLLNRLDGGAPVHIAIGVVALVVSGAIFLQRQFRSATPITDWSLFRHRTYSAAAAYVLLSNLVMYTTLLAIPFFVREVQGKSVATVGLLLGAMSIFMAGLSPLAGRFSDEHGRRLPANIGSAVMMCGAFAMVFGIARDVSFVYLAGTLLTIGLGLGLSIGAASTAAIESAPRSAAGVAAGTNSMMRYVGSIVGAGVLGSVLSRDSGAPEVDVFRLMFGIVAAMAVLGFVSTLFIERHPARRIEDPLDGVGIAPGVAG